MNNVSRRNFLITASASAASSVFLKGCFGNPPETSGTAETVAPIEVSAEQKPEVTKIKLGYLPIVESAPLIVAQAKGFFRKYGMTEVEVAKQSNWASARDNVTIGSEAGGIDGGQWQMPMPYLLSEGLITTGNEKIPMYVLAQLNTQGNGIAIANAHAGKNIGLDLSKGGGDYIKSFQKDKGRKFKAAFTFPKANQEFWIRYWMAAGGIDPDKDIELLTIPPAETVQGMRNGTLDAFSTGDPWPARIVADDVGFLGALTSEMWKFHPEEYLAIRADWVDKHPKATKAVLKAVMDAQQWCDDDKNRAELAKILAGRNYFNVPETVLLPPFEGKYKMGDGKPEISDKNMSTLYWKDGVGSVSYPYKSHDMWFLTESVRWGFLKPDFLGNAKTLIDKVNRSDLWLEAAKEAGITDVPTSDTRGVEKFFDGVEFDSTNPEAYLNSLKIKKA